MSYSLLFDEIYYNDMTKRTSKWLACDHTFKSAANIGMTRESDGRWIKAMKCIFCVLGENGDVLHWRFTRGESFDEVREMFQELKVRHEKANVAIEGIIIDNCCKWKGLLSEMFPNVAVKLDLFHAVQRFVSTLPMTVRLQSDICKRYGLVFRESSDIGDNRLQPTPNKETLLLNLESFENKWKFKKIKGNEVLNPAAKKALANIKVHITKGCLSNIPIHVTTSGNERLHRHLNTIMKSNRIGIDTAFVRCSRLFFKNNNKLLSGDKSSSLLLSCTKAAVGTSNCNRAEHFGLQTLGHNKDELIVQTTAATTVYKSLHEMTTNALGQIRECIRFSLLSEGEHNDHTYTQGNQAQNNLALSIAYSALTFFEIYKGLNDIGATRLISKSDLPSSIGLGSSPVSGLQHIGLSNCDTVGDKSYATHHNILSGHLEAFGLEQVEIRGDGNCFFSSVAFQLLKLFSSDESRGHVIDHFANIGLTSDMCVQSLSIVLRNMVVEEWRGNAAAQYASFLPNEVDYFMEVARFESEGVFSGPVGDLMPLAVANVLGIPLVIITSEPSNPLISVCPNGNTITSAPIFLAYTSDGPGHYDAVITQTKLSSGTE